MTPKQKAQYMLGMLDHQIKKGEKPFSSAEDAMAACNLIIEDFGEHYPPHLVDPYWRAVREQIILLTNK